MRQVGGPVYVVGAAMDSDLVLGDLQFPDLHFYLLVAKGIVSLRHLGDDPEITVNGRVAHRTRLLDGDRIRTGPFEFLLHVGAEDEIRSRVGRQRLG
jgi:hypothetical protein